MLTEALDAMRAARPPRDIREYNPLQMAYIGDTLHDLCVRSLLLSGGMAVGGMHRQAVRMVSAGAQARMLEVIEPELTEDEADAARRGRNAQAKHAAPKNADPGDYAHATGLEALWGYLYITKQNERLSALMADALASTEALWQRQSSR